MLSKQKKFKADKLINSLQSTSFFIFQLGNVTVESQLEIQKLFSKYGLKSTRVKNKIFQRLFLPEYKINKFSQSSTLIVENVTPEIYKIFISKLMKAQNNLTLIGIKEKNHYYLPNKIKQIFTTLKTKTVKEDLNLNLLNLNKILYVCLKVNINKKTG